MGTLLPEINITYIVHYEYEKKIKRPEQPQLALLKKYHVLVQTQANNSIRAHESWQRM